jgi:hypothetical protein
MNQEVFKEYVQHAMDNQSGVLMNIINNAIKGAFSDFAQQQGYVASYCQQSIYRLTQGHQHVIRGFLIK